MEDNLIDILSGVEGISVADGLEYCGSTAAFIKFIKTFYYSIEKKAQDIKDAYERGDFSTYTTKVHALKSTSRFIGASKLSELALRLEEAGNAGDISFIRENNDRFLELYTSYIDKLSVLDSAGKTASDSDAGKPISEAELKDAYRSLNDSIEMMDYDAIEFILSEIKGYRLSAGDRNTMESLGKLLVNLEWEKMSNLLSGKN
ncbi:MAG: Hpt domain-containing protein [Butyrivibrio sp.]|nr:Hpt domain-containing protein [Butyrivibrio sp.]